MSAALPLGGGEDYEAAAREAGVDLAWALREFPVPVYFRGTGRFALLRWSHESIGSHLIVARSLTTLAHRAQALIERRDGDVRFHEACEAEVVGPAPRMTARYALDTLEMQARLFWSHVGSWLSTAPPDDLPPIAVACPYDPEEGGGLDAELDPEHFSCAQCDATRVVPAVPLLPLYVSLRDRYEASLARLLVAHGSHQKGYRGAPGRAAPADDDATVWGAFADHGPHARGSFLALVDKAWSSHTQPLFFFRRLDPIDVPPLNVMADRYVADRDRRASAKALDDLARREAEEAAYHAELRAMLRSVPRP